MNRLEEYRALALQELRSQMQGSTPLLVDELLDSLLRHAKGLPARPHKGEPYSRLFTLPELPKVILQGFRGDLAWVHDREGHKGSAYWPGGESGVTLDPGLDVGHTPPARVRELYAGRLNGAQLNALEGAYKKIGTAAQKMLSNPIIATIHITFAQANALMPYTAQPFWEAITRRFPDVLEPNTPGSVQTVLLSLAYNRGAGNPQLSVLKQHFASSDYLALAREVGAMQQNHQLRGIRERRKLEQQFIEAELKKLGR